MTSEVLAQVQGSLYFKFRNILFHKMLINIQQIIITIICTTQWFANALGQGNPTSNLPGSNHILVLLISRVSCLLILLCLKPESSLNTSHFEF